MTFLEFLLELMMILMFLTGAGVLDDILHGLNMSWGSYVKNKYDYIMDAVGMLKLSDKACVLHDVLYCLQIIFLK